MGLYNLDTLLAEIDVPTIPAPISIILRGRHNDWLELADEFINRECWIGIVYAILLGLSLEDLIPAYLTDLVTENEGLF
jgi:hypothetical protein